MEFSPFNHIVKRCLQGISLEEKGQPAQAGEMFLQAWQEATNDFERFLAAYFVARQQTAAADKLQWYQASLQFAETIHDESVQSAFPTLHFCIAKCYEELGDLYKAKSHFELGKAFTGKPTDSGPFYHGTRAALQVGDLLTAGHGSNYKQGLVMNHIYFTALRSGAALAAAMSQADGPDRVYIVEPTGEFENDPNVTDKKFPGNLTRSYRTHWPLQIVGDATRDLPGASEELEKWRQELANNKGDIIN